MKSILADMEFSRKGHICFRVLQFRLYQYLIVLEVQEAVVNEEMEKSENVVTGMKTVSEVQQKAFQVEQLFEIHMSDP